MRSTNWTTITWSKAGHVREGRVEFLRAGHLLLESLRAVRVRAPDS